MRTVWWPAPPAKELRCDLSSCLHTPVRLLPISFEYSVRRPRRLRITGAGLPISAVTAWDNFACEDGVATLSGFVWDPQDIYRASELAAHLPGVNDVIDEIELKRQEYR